MTNIALITGPTSGIGRAFADLLAGEKYDLVLVARNDEKLKLLAGRLAGDYGINTYPIRCDLEKPGAADFVYQRVTEIGVEIDLLINNAGFNEFGNFLNTDRVKETEMIQIHAVFPTEMMKLFLPDMIRKSKGRVLNIGSTGSYIPCPYDAVYAAAKAYILSVSKAINAELKGTGVSITTLCPGATKTEFAKKAGMENTLLFKRSVMEPDVVARIGYKALKKGKVSVIAGMNNKIQIAMSLLLPNAVVNDMTKKMLS